MDSSSSLGPSLEQYAVLVPIQISDIAFILGYISNFGLLGVLSIQVLIYTTRFRRDPIFLQLTVLSVFFLEVFNSVLVVYWERDYITYGVPISETISTWAFQAQCVLTGLSSSIVQAFFSWRIWILGRSVWIPIVVNVLSLAQCVLLMTGGILSSTNPNMGVFDTHGAVIWLLISAACDIVITIRTSQLLFQSRDRSNCRATQSLVRRLVKITIETGLVTVIGTFLEFAIAQTLGIAHHGVFYALSKLYANCLLATLNARLVIYNRSMMERGGTTSVVASAVFEPGGISLSHSLPDDIDVFPGSHKTQRIVLPLGEGKETEKYRTVGVQSTDDVDSERISDANPCHSRRSSSCMSIE